MGVLAKGSLIRKQIILMGGDTLAGVMLLAVIEKMGSDQIPIRFLSDVTTLLFIPVLVLSSYFCEIYTSGVRSFKAVFLRSLAAMGISSLVLVLSGIFSGISWPMIIGIPVFFMFQMLWQQLYLMTARFAFFNRNIVVIGTGDTAREVDRMIMASPGKYTFSGYIATAIDPVMVEKSKIIGKIDNILDLCRQYQIHTIVIALTEKRGSLTIDKLVSCKLMGVRIVDYPSFYENMTGKIPVESINPSWLVQSRGFLITPLIRFMKRGFDILLSSAALLLTLPFFPVIAFLVKYRSPGPVFYFQKRVGKNGRLFTIYKFRSMGIDAETETGAAWAKTNDPRLSRFGHLLRKTRIDELPQLVNVLSGKMSFIGPRPERPEFVEQISAITPYYMERHAIKPGITGWAQVMYPYGSSLGDSVEKLRYDLYYINNLSMFLELLIIFKTIKVIVFQRGAR